VNSGEFQRDTNPNVADSDYDGVSDGDEVNVYGSNPLAWDTDGDGLNDGFEVQYGFDPTVITDTTTDTDNDGLDLQGEHDYGSDPTNPDTDGDGINDGPEAEAGTSPTNGDSDGDGVPDGFEIALKAKTTYKSRYKYGFSTYQTTTPPKRYLKEVVSWSNMSGGNPESGPIGVGPGSRTREIDPLTGDMSTQTTGVGGSYPSTATSPTTKHDTITIYGYDDPPNEINDEPGTVTADATLSNEHTTAMLRQNTNNTIPAYPSDFSSYGYAYEDTSTDELYYSLQKMKYKFKFGKSIQASLNWVEMFRPENKPETQEDESQDPTFTGKTWSGSGAETSEFEIDPYAIDPTKDGSYEVVYVDSVFVDYTDPETHGVPSTQYDVNIRGKTHFVCVKNTGDIVLRAYLNTWIPEPGMNKITWDAAGTTITSPAVSGAGGSKLTAKLPSTVPGKYPVTMKIDGKILWEGVVWVVWCDGAAPQNVSVTPSGATTGDATSPAPGSTFVVPSNTLRYFEFTINPVEIITDTDVPKLSGAKSANNALPGAAVLQTGADKKWDVSRRIRIKHENPAPTTILRSHLWGSPNHTEGLDAYAASFPSTAIEVLFYPTDEREGNDDRGVGDEDNDPYSNTQSVGAGIAPTAKGKLASRDDVTTPFILQSTGNVGEQTTIKVQFGEFVRLELGSGSYAVWYRASDFVNWQAIQRFQRGASGMSDNGSTVSNDNANY
jgi:hypothetical protein